MSENESKNSNQPSEVREGFEIGVALDDENKFQGLALIFTKEKEGKTEKSEPIILPPSHAINLGCQLIHEARSVQEQLEKMADMEKRKAAKSVLHLPPGRPSRFS